MHLHVLSVANKGQIEGKQIGFNTEKMSEVASKARREASVLSKQKGTVIYLLYSHVKRDISKMQTS